METMTDILTQLKNPTQEMVEVVAKAMYDISITKEVAWPSLMIDDASLYRRDAKAAIRAMAEYLSKQEKP